MNLSSKIPALVPGLTFEARQIVTDRQTVPRVEPDWHGFSDMPPVFATAMMVGFIERWRATMKRGLIGEGTHRRAIVDAVRFLEKLKTKQAGGNT